MRTFRFSCALTLVTLAALALACSSKAPLVALGGDCQLATDCQDGLICAPQNPQKTGSNACPCSCTNSTQGVQQLPPAADGGKPTGGGQDAASVTDSAPSSPVPEASAGG